MINFRNVIIAGIAGTLTKTLFSYIWSFLEERQLKVPEVLGTMLTGETGMTGNTSQSPQALTAGYAAHIATGIAFTACYELLWRMKIGRPTPKYGAIFGAVNGVFGTLVWVAYLYFHPRNPRIPVRSYVLDLLINHVLFGVTIAYTYQLMGQKKLSAKTTSHNETSKDRHNGGVQDTGGEPQGSGS